MVAGGTGGHIFPALALARELSRWGVILFWAGMSEGMEKDIAEKNGFKFYSLSKRLNAQRGQGAAGLRRYGLCIGQFFSGLQLLSRLNPDGVVATGSYVTVGILLAALIKKKRFFLLEQNRIPGRATRFFAPFAAETFLTFPVEGPFRGFCSVVGSPLREEILQTKREDDGKTVVVLGGSQGARSLNLAAVDMAVSLPNYHFIILTGRRDYPMLKSLRRSKNCELIDWTDHPEEIYRRATIAISRAGGMVTSELLFLGIPAILVPFPYATDQHQEANAQFLAAIGAAIVLRENQLSGLVSLVQTLMTDEKKREEMGMRARQIARPDSARVIAERIIQCLGD